MNWRDISYLKAGDSRQNDVFGQAVSVKDQYAFRHMLIEHKILKSKGDKFRNKILALKEKGLSTEEAFASLLGIDGDPYTELLRFEAQ